MAQTEAFARTLIDAQLDDQGWKISDGISVRYEYTLPDGDRADYLLCGRERRGLATCQGTCGLRRLAGQYVLKQGR